jgi:hypothetical protein
VNRLRRSRYGTSIPGAGAVHYVAPKAGLQRRKACVGHFGTPHVAIRCGYLIMLCGIKSMICGKASRMATLMMSTNTNQRQPRKMSPMLMSLTTPLGYFLSLGKTPATCLYTAVGLSLVNLPRCDSYVGGGSLSSTSSMKLAACSRAICVVLLATRKRFPSRAVAVRYPFRSFKVARSRANRRNRASRSAASSRGLLLATCTTVGFDLLRLRVGVVMALSRLQRTATNKYQINAQKGSSGRLGLWIGYARTRVPE